MVSANIARLKKLNAINVMDKKKTCALAWNDAQNAIKYSKTALTKINVINLGKTLFPACFGGFCVKFAIFLGVFV